MRNEHALTLLRFQSSDGTDEIWALYVDNELFEWQPERHFNLLDVSSRAINTHQPINAMSDYVWFYNVDWFDSMDTPPATLSEIPEEVWNEEFHHVREMHEVQS